MPYIEPVDDESGDCQIMGFFGILVQAVLAALSIGSLIGKLSLKYDKECFSEEVLP